MGVKTLSTALDRAISSARFGALFPRVSLDAFCGGGGGADSGAPPPPPHACVLLDGNALVGWLVFAASPPTTSRPFPLLFGGDYAALDCAVRAFVAAWARRGVAVVAAFDGDGGAAAASFKADTAAARAAEHAHEVVAIVN